jgi:hypothetical protein
VLDEQEPPSRVITQAVWLFAASRPTIAPEEVCMPLFHVEPPSSVKRTS